jgi:hypothetical protein
MDNPVIKPIDDQEKDSSNPIETELHELLSRKTAFQKLCQGHHYT